MPHQDLGLCRSLLFLPASNPRAIEKARDLEADMIILDLEDAVAEEDKDSAREAAVAATHAGFGDRKVAIRINAAGSRHHGPDMLAARRSAARLVVLPKAETVRDIHDAKVVCERAVATMIETPLGVLNAAELASASAALIAGTNDLAASLRIPPGMGRPGLAVSLQRIVLAARAAHVPVFDGVYNRLDDRDGLEAEALEGRSFGFDGKSVIHPGQIETVNSVFSPSADELAAAEALIASAAGGARRHEGRMVEELHVAQARLLVAKARR
jgi:citrate lyase subunit beta/citryl-CoA lyase